jgi:thiosulfate dehydrogenase (quinone) large subunit
MTTVTPPRPSDTAPVLRDGPVVGPTATANTPAAPVEPAVDKTVAGSAFARYTWFAARIGLGWIFLWAFLDKTFGFGFATPAGKGWIDGGSPTNGFLSGAEGPFAGFYQNLAGTAFANITFMVGLLGIGVALLAGIGMRIAAASGALLMIMMYTVALPPATNPVIDDHLILAVLLVGLAVVGAGNTLGLGRWWAATPLVKRLPWLK